ncbi:MAG TPA: MFS transporter [Dehalococcoidia bacterium]|nr:MFS transporter [Dehalococcoidia bacterium]
MIPIGLLSRLEAASHRSAGYRWSALGITTVSAATNAALATAIGPLAPLLQREFQVSRAEIGLVTSALFLSAALSAPFAGRTSDRIGERRVLLISSLIAGVAAICLAQVPVFWAFLAVCLLIGFGSGMQNPAGSAAIMRWFPQRQRGVAMGIRQTGIPIGGILSATVWSWVAAAQGWRAAYVVGGVVTLIGAALLFAAYFDPARPKGGAQAEPRSFRDIFRDSQLWWLALIFNCQVIVQFAATTYLVLFLEEGANVPYVVGTSLFALLNAVALGARIGWGLLSDRRFGGRRKPVLTIIVVLTLAGTIVAALLPGATPVWLAVILAALLGISAFAWTAIVGALTIETAGRASAGTAMAMLTVVGSPGQLVGPPLFGLLRDQTGSYQIAWLALAGVVLVGLIAVIPIRERTAPGARSA